MYSSPQNRSLAALAFALAVLALPWRAAAPSAAAVDRLLARMNERLAVMPDVARWKWNTRRPITDPPRERALLDDVARRGAARGLDPAFVRRFFAAQIDAAKEMQQSALARWTADGDPVVPVRDLSSLRKRIDQINSALLDELPAVTAALADPALRRTVPARSRRLLRAAGVTDRVRTIAVAPLLGEREDVSPPSASRRARRLRADSGPPPAPARLASAIGDVFLLATDYCERGEPIAACMVGLRGDRSVR